MPKEISGLRIAKSYITPTDTEVTRIIDFQLGARQGIEIVGVLADMSTGPWTPSATALTAHFGNHTLHLEAGSLETVPEAAGEDEDTIDSEIFFRQAMTVIAIDEPTAQGAAGIIVTPNGFWRPPARLYTARNVTHRGKTVTSAMDINCHILMYYIFVEFTLPELGLILARRQ